METALETKLGIRQEQFRTFSVPLPKPVYESLREAEEKIARALSIDIETNPGSRILVREALAQWILQTDEDTLKLQTEGA